MKRTGLAAAGAALFIIGLRPAAAGFDSGFWGLDFFRYITPAGAIVYTAVPVLLLVTSLFARRYSSSSEEPRPSVGRRLLLLLAPAVLMFTASVATPLLGDGLERVEATAAGLKSLVGQPAPLDLLIHVGLFKIMAAADQDSWRLSWLVWRSTSYASGVFAVFFLYKLSGLRSATWSGRSFVFLATLFSGTFVFFAGYPENYVILAAALYGYLLLFELAGRGRAPVWTLFAALVFLIGLHYFMVLLAPAVFFALYRHNIWRPSKAALAAAAVVLLIFALMVSFVVREHYRGLAIFVSPGDLLGCYHLIGFVNQQIIAGPALPLLIPLAFMRRSQSSPDPLLSFAGGASLILIAFFFFLRPVIGPAADWDLFAIPSLVYTPWLVLRVLQRWRSSEDFMRISFPVLALVMASTFPWISINARESASIARFRDVMEWEAGYNDWAASYGYYRLGKYLARDSTEIGKEEAARALGRAVEINPDSATLRLQTALVFKAMGNNEQADMQMAEHHLLLAGFAERDGEYARAAEQYNKALGYAPSSKKILKALRMLYQGRAIEPDEPANIKAGVEPDDKN
jgi:hypothetical protein